VSLGLLEARPNPFTAGDGGNVGTTAHRTSDRGFVRVANPLAEDEPYLRREVLDTLARRAEDNLAHMQGDIRLFEIGSVFSPAGDGGAAGTAGAAGRSPASGARGLPVEAVHVGALVMGRRYPAHFAGPAEQAWDEWDARAIAQVAARAAHPAGEIRLEAGREGWLWRVLLDGRDIGGVLHVELDAPVWASPAFGVELALAVMPNADVAPHGQNAHAAAPAAPARHWPRYQPSPSTPAAEFDLALLLPGSVTAGQVEACIRDTAGELLERLELFDLYTGKGIPDGTRSVAWRLTFRHPERTLRDKEIEGRRSKILGVLDKELHVKQRTG
jgi:phenylalanyl-tRNA synthetase beta chain